MFTTKYKYIAIDTDTNFCHLFENERTLGAFIHKYPNYNTIYELRGLVKVKLKTEPVYSVEPINS